VIQIEDNMPAQFTETLLIRLSPEEKARLFELAGEHGTKPAQLARDAIREKLDEMEKKLGTKKPMTVTEAAEFEKNNGAVCKHNKEIRELNDYTERLPYEMRCHLSVPSDKLKSIEKKLFDRCRAEIEQHKKEIEAIDNAFSDSINEYCLSDVPEAIQSQLEKANTKNKRPVLFVKVGPLNIINETEKAVKIELAGAAVEREIWLPKLWVKISDDKKYVIEVTKKALNKISLAKE